MIGKLLEQKIQKWSYNWLKKLGTIIFHWKAQSVDNYKVLMSIFRITWFLEASQSNFNLSLRSRTLSTTGLWLNQCYYAMIHNTCLVPISIVIKQCFVTGNNNEKWYFPTYSHILYFVYYDVGSKTAPTLLVKFAL